MYLLDLNTKTNKKDLVSRKTRPLFFYRFHEIFLKVVKLMNPDPEDILVYTLSFIFFLFSFFFIIEL